MMTSPPVDVPVPALRKTEPAVAVVPVALPPTIDTSPAMELPVLGTGPPRIATPAPVVPADATPAVTLTVPPSPELELVPAPANSRRVPPCEGPKNDNAAEEIAC